MGITNHQGDFCGIGMGMSETNSSYPNGLGGNWQENSDAFFGESCYNHYNDKSREEKKMSFAVIAKNQCGIVGCTDGRSTNRNGDILDDDLRKIWKFPKQKVLIISTGINEVPEFNNALRTYLKDKKSIAEIVNESVPLWNGKSIIGLVDIIHSQLSLPIAQYSDDERCDRSVQFLYGFFEDEAPLIASSSLIGRRQSFSTFHGWQPSIFSSGKHFGCINEVQVPETDTLLQMDSWAHDIVETAVHLETINGDTKPVVGGKIRSETLEVSK